MAVGESLSALQYQFYSSAVNNVSATSVMANGSQNAPTANTAVATTADLSAGTWDVEVTGVISGTTVAALEADNMRFKIGGTPVAAVLVPVPGTAGGSATGRLHCRVNLGGSAPLSVIANANSTAASVYKAQIVATKIGN